MLAGSLMSWFASMLDGVDGELARARFQTSDFGSWLETVCDYLYYLFILWGIGLYRTTQDALWLVLGGGSAVGVVLSFWVVARQRKKYAREGDVAAYGLAFQRAVGSQAANPLYSFLRRCTFLSTRAALPYFIVVFAALGLVDLVLVFMFVGAHLAWTLASYAGRLRFV
jgi:phosphatidylglycerophosphate synthase